METQLGDLSEQGFVDTYYALAANRIQSQRPKAYRTALSELDEMLLGNLEMLSIDSLVDLANLLVWVMK